MKRSTMMLIPVILVVFLIGNAGAQGNVKRTAGLTASLQGGQATILIPIWVGNTTTIAPGIGLWYTDGVSTVVDLVISPRLYMRMDRVAPYFGGHLGAEITIPDGAGSTTTNWHGGVAFGGEYFVNVKFSFGVEGQLNVTILDSALAGASDFMVHTAAAVHANVYF